MINDQILSKKTILLNQTIQAKTKHIVTVISLCYVKINQKKFEELYKVKNCTISNIKRQIRSIFWITKIHICKDMELIEKKS